MGDFLKKAYEDAERAKIAKSKTPRWNLWCWLFGHKYIVTGGEINPHGREFIHYNCERCGAYKGQWN